jgi:hypothetical protein
MKVIFIRAKSTVEENYFVDLVVGWSGKAIDESTPVQMILLNAKREPMAYLNVQDII